MTSGTPYASAKHRLHDVAPRTAPWVAVAALWWWVGTGPVWALLVAAVSITGAIGWAGRRGSRPWAGGAVLVVAAILVGFVAERQVGVILRDWDGYWSDRVDEIGDLLSGELDRRQRAGEALGVYEGTTELLGDRTDQQRSIRAHQSRLAVN